MIADECRLPSMCRCAHGALQAGADGAPTPRTLPSQEAVANLLTEARAAKGTAHFPASGRSRSAMVAHEKTDTFRERVEYSNRSRASSPLLEDRVRMRFGASKKGWGRSRMWNPESRSTSTCRTAPVGLGGHGGAVGEDGASAGRTVLVREQLALALNRLQRPTRRSGLTRIIEQRGPSSETLAHTRTRLQGPLGEAESR